MAGKIRSDNICILHDIWHLIRAQSIITLSSSSSWLKFWEGKRVPLQNKTKFKTHSYLESPAGNVRCYSAILPLFSLFSYFLLFFSPHSVFIFDTCQLIFYFEALPLANWYLMVLPSSPSNLARCWAQQRQSSFSFVITFFTLIHEL